MRRHLLAVRQLDLLVARRGEDQARERGRVDEGARERAQIRLRETLVAVVRGAHPELDAERARLLERGLQDDRLDEHLPPAHVELLDHGAERLPVLGRGAHDERVGGGVGREAHGRGERDRGGRAGGRGLGHGADRGGRRRLPHAAVVAEGGDLRAARGAPRERAAVRLGRRGRAHRLPDQLCQHAHQAVRRRVLEMVDVDARAPRRDGLVEACRDGARPPHLVGRAGEHEGVRARVGGDAEHLAPDRVAQAPRGVLGGREAQRHDLGRALARGHVEVGEERGQTVDVGARVDHDQAVGGRIGRQQAVLRDQRLEHGHEPARLRVAERQDAGHDLVAAAGAARHRLARGHDLRERAARHRGEALHLQDGLENEVGLVGRDPGRRDDGHLAAHAVVDDEVPPGDLAHELGEHGQLHVLEVERDGGLLGGPGGAGEHQEEGEGRSHRRS